MLDEVQKQTVRGWGEEGASLSDVQRRISSEFGISMTYMDVRFLVLDLNAAVKDKPEPKQVEPATPAMEDAAAPALGAEEMASESAGQEYPETADEGAAAPSADENYTPADLMDANVKVELDRIVRAGALASGTVTFTDGVTGSWYLDRMGRLGLTKVSQPNYQPTRADLEAFQIELGKKISAGGF